MKYYIIVNDVQLGPLDAAELPKVGATPATPVWHEGLADWTTCGLLPELQPFFGMTGYAPNPYAAPVNPGPATAPGAAYYDGGVPECPPSYLAWSIVVCILCCIPFGIVAIIKSCEVNSAWQRGDYDRASRSSRQAQTWIIVSVVTGLITSVLWGLMQFVLLA